MTEKLQTLMREQADSVEFAVPDIETVMHRGDRRVRTRRLGVVGSVAAAVAAAALVVPALAPGDRDVAPAGPTSPGAAPLTWVTGSVLHERDREHDLPFRPRAYVRTADGYVFSDREGTVWSWVGESASEVGRTHPRHPHLVADDESGLAGWVDSGAGGSGSDADARAYAVLDQSTGEVSTFATPDRVDPDEFLAIDAGTAYWRGARGLVAYNLGTGRSQPVAAGGIPADVEDDLLAVRTDAGIVVRTVAGEQVRALTDFHGEVGFFSDDARYFTNDADEPQVFDLAAGERVRLDVGGRGFATGYEWLGDGAIAVIAAQHDGAVAELLQCQVPAGSCEPVAELGTFDEIADQLVLPVGEATDS